MRSDSTVKYSVVLILEEKKKEKVTGFAQYLQWIYGIFKERGDPFEMLIIANGCESLLRAEFENIIPDTLKTKAFAFSKQVPHAVCLNASLNESSGDIMVICGPYQQLTGKAFVKLLNAFDSGDANLISPWRKNRLDPAFNQLQSKLFNAMVRWITGMNIHDLGANVKVFHRQVLESVKLYGNMYLFLPVLAERKGFKTREILCDNYKALGRTGLYSFSEYLTRIIDILTLYFNTRFSKKPLRFFSTVGAFFMLIGFSIGFWILFQRIFESHGIGSRPELLIAMIFILFGVQAVSVGLLGEIIAFTLGRHIKEYSVAWIASQCYDGPERRKRADRRPGKSMLEGECVSSSDGRRLSG